MRVRAALQAAWLRRGPLAWLLLPLTVIYALLSGARRSLYRQGWLRAESLPIPVVVIGNVIAGGAGKTPVVMAIARHLLDRGIPCGVVSRGHGRRGDDCLEVLPGSDPAQVGDEPLLIASQVGVPVVVAQRRPAAVHALLARHPEVRVVLSDDGLQHHALARDVEIVVFDDRGVGNGWLLPSGPLREPWPRPADLVIRTECTPDIGGFVIKRHLATEAARGDGARLTLRTLAGQRCAAVAGIARPEAFFEMLRREGIALAATIALPDHHDYSAPLPPMPAGLPLLCTEKDAAKLWKSHPEAWAVPLSVEIEAGFFESLDALLTAKLSSPHGSQAA
ncbi:tetraacyldisaccharide 4'-kinase [Ramlibacter sp. MMS24-I3-19]|uniref:tetraacyldisaccharide 4'-kinase n=1 Tax=Ramlibacter sp. MMS24-I3-19 TaxID=3416606 RepID=UPI003D003EE0